jgi:hypothetical protein
VPAILPGLPVLLFLTLAGASDALAWHLARRERDAAAPAAEAAAAAPVVD